jgi:hypothetical protein
MEDAHTNSYDHHNTPDKAARGGGAGSHVNNVHFPTNPSHYSKLNRKGKEKRTTIFDELRDHKCGPGVPS